MNTMRNRNLFRVTPLKDGRWKRFKRNIKEISGVVLALTLAFVMVVGPFLVWVLCLAAVAKLAWYILFQWN